MKLKLVLPIIVVFSAIFALVTPVDAKTCPAGNSGPTHNYSDCLTGCTKNYNACTCNNPSKNCSQGLTTCQDICKQQYGSSSNSTGNTTAQRQSYTSSSSSDGDYSWIWWVVGIVGIIFLSALFGNKE